MRWIWPAAHLVSRRGVNQAAYRPQYRVLRSAHFKFGVLAKSCPNGNTCCATTRRAKAKLGLNAIASPNVSVQGQKELSGPRAQKSLSLLVISSRRALHWEN